MVEVRLDGGGGGGGGRGGGGGGGGCSPSQIFLRTAGFGPMPKSQLQPVQSHVSLFVILFPPPKTWSIMGAAFFSIHAHVVGEPSLALASAAVAGKGMP